MIKICNAQFANALFEKLDLFICTISYEQRSYFLLDQIIPRLSNENTLIFATDNYTRFENARNKVNEIKRLHFCLDIVDYRDSMTVLARIKSAIQKKIEEKEAVVISIDYSSMPRSWYSRLPGVIQTILRPADTVYFWYSEGNYPPTYSEYPTAGLEKMFDHFSGKASLFAEKRAHIFALSYDIVRTQGIIDKLEPEYVIVCEAHDPTRDDIHKNIAKANENLMTQAAMVVSLDLSDFSFMVTKLRELANELSRTSDVIFVPDGPKPLILAMSQIPDLLNKPGITCIHANRNLEKFVPVDVPASGKIVGFYMNVSNDEPTTP